MLVEGVGERRPGVGVREVRVREGVGMVAACGLGRELGEGAWGEVWFV